jgi:amino acid transporter
LAEYSIELAQEFNVKISSLLTSVFVALGLLSINILGSRKVGKLQNFAVIGLSLILLVIFIYGLADILGISGQMNLYDEFAPNGYSSVFSTTALVFTSYLGFVQISTVAGEIKNPKKNLPRALVSSVLIVLTMYLLIIFITTSLFSTDELSSFGETATLEVGRKLLGRTGALVVLVAGLLATLSSSNASILSSSRSLYALSKDRLMPKKLGEVRARYGSPYISLIIVVVLVIAMLFIGNLELFAEVASFLHLVMYGGISISLIILRRKNFSWYKPAFKAPFGRLIGWLGAPSCLALIFFMQNNAIMIGFVVLGVTAVFYWIINRKKDYDLKRTQPD